MSLESVMQELAALGSESTKKVFKNHGAPEPFFGVKVGDMKTIVKRIKKDHALSLALYNTGNSDAQYLAGLIADEQKITKADLQHWAKNASWYMQSEYTVAWVASESAFGWELALEWIESPEERIATAGWATLSSLVSIKPDAELDLPALDALLDRVARDIVGAQNRVRYTMNGFVIAVGGAVAPLSARAMETAQKIGKVSVDVGGTACKVPFAPEYIGKIVEMGRVGHKRKMARC